MRADKAGVTLDGKPLSDYGLFVTSEGWKVGECKPATATTTIPGVSGGLDATIPEGGMLNGPAAMGRRDITLHVGTVGDPMQIMEAKAAIGALLGTVVILSLSAWGRAGTDLRTDVSDLYSADAPYWRGRLASSDWADVVDTRGRVVASTATLTVDADPFQYGPVEHILLSPVTTYQLPVLGNRPVWYTLTVTSDATASKPLNYSIGFDGGYVIHATLKANTSTITLPDFRTVAADVPISQEPQPLTPGYHKFAVSHDTDIEYTPLTLM